MKMATAALRAAILCYQYALSPVLPGTCRFQPTCSSYALEAVTRFGAWKGGRLMLKRIGRCHPWGGLGFDPVPALDCRHRTERIQQETEGAPMPSQTRPVEQQATHF